MQLSKPGEYHPVALCGLMKATGDEEGARAAIASVLRDSRSLESALQYRVTVFLLQIGSRFRPPAPEPAEEPRRITSEGPFQGVRRALRRPFFGRAT